MNHCTHTRRTPDEWVEEHEDDWGIVVRAHWKYGTEVSTFEDLDLHRMQCSQCGAIEYYSGAARAFYERGERTGIFEDGGEV